jgi:hypothetical protein
MILRINCDYFLKVMDTKLWIESFKGKDHLKDLVVDARIILNGY